MKAEEQSFSILIDQRKFTIFFDEQDKNMAPAVAVESTWEPWQLDLYKLTIEPSHTCIDAGANVGINSVIMAHYAKGGFVHSFEPVKRTRELLEKNKAANKSDNVIVVGTGLGDEPALAVITVDRGSLGTSNIVDATSPQIDGANSVLQEPANSERISIQRLDDYWHGIGRPVVDFLKIDVEGYEQKVLMGAQDLLRYNRNLLLICEVNIHSQVKIHDLENGVVGAHNLLTIIQKNFLHIYLMGRDSKLYSVSSYAQLRLFMLSGYPVDDLFCCNIFPDKLKGKLASSWMVPERLTAECELYCESSVLYINRNADGWARPTPEIEGTRGGAILHLSQEHNVTILLKGILKEFAHVENPLLAVTINNSTQVVRLDGPEEKVTLSLSSGVHFIFVESLFEIDATHYFNNPIDNRKIGAHFSIAIEAVD